MARRPKLNYAAYMGSGTVGRIKTDPETYYAVDHLYRRIYGYLNPKTRARTGVLKIELDQLTEAQKAVPREDDELSRYAARLVAHMLCEPITLGEGDGVRVIRVRGTVSGPRVTNMLSELKRMRQDEPGVWGKNPFDEVVDWMKGGEADEPLS